MSCQATKDKNTLKEVKLFSNLQEVQLTKGQKGHFLHSVQSYSPDDQWLVYDTRNDDTHIGRTSSIEMVNLDTKEVKKLYSTKNQTEFGPGVGAVTFNPKKPQVLFIHGLQNCSSEKPYGFSRRTGVSIKTETPQQAIYLDARDVVPPFTPGALRGGTHAHTWSNDGEWVSFTYNDDIMTKLSQQNIGGIKDLRMVGIMAPIGPVIVDKEVTGENIDGQLFSVIVSEVVENPDFGTDQIDRAYGDSWIGNNGYMKRTGERQERAIAFFGDTRAENGNLVTEVFRVDLTNNIHSAKNGSPIEGTTSTRPMPPNGVYQKRLTFTSGRKHGGVQGPRHSIGSLPDGSQLFFMMKDETGIIQVYSVSPRGGQLTQITYNNTSIETAFAVSPDGKYLCYGMKDGINITDISSGVTREIKKLPHGEEKSLRAINWSHNGKMIAYNRKVIIKDTSYYQIFVLKLRKYGVK